MSTGIFLLVLAAACLHALWNAGVKSGADKVLNMTAVVIGQGLFGAVSIPFAPPLDMVCWPYLIAGIGLHMGYQWFLMSSYRLGDLTQVYPIARGTAPLLVAAVSIGFLGVKLGPLELLGVVTIAVGIISLSLVRRQDGLRNGRAATFAVVTGVFIASYSIVDGYGARLGGSAVGFFGWLSLGNATLFTLLIWRRRPALPRDMLRVPAVVLLGGGASFTAYAMVVYAFMHAPIALVTALRETSIVFALLIGVFVLKERLDLVKLASVGATIGGAILLRLSKG